MWGKRIMSDQQVLTVFGMTLPSLGMLWEDSGRALVIHRNGPAIASACHDELWTLHGFVGDETVPLAVRVGAVEQWNRWLWENLPSHFLKDCFDGLEPTQ